MRALVVKKVSFDAAHFLPRYNGKCKNIHGHTWKVEVGIEGEVCKVQGMVVDFSDLKKDLSKIIQKFDHHLLNDTIKNPTAENIAFYIQNKLLTTPTLLTRAGLSCKLKWVRVYESEDSYAEVSNE